MSALAIGDRVKLREGVMFGPVIEMRIDRILKNGEVDASSDDRRTRVRVTSADIMVRPAPDLCGCHVCDNAYAKAMESYEPEGWHRGVFMILCPSCGCKRCPKATFHEHDCTGSNESGQHGSIYGGFGIDTSWMDVTS